MPEKNPRRAHSANRPERMSPEGKPRGSASPHVPGLNRRSPPRRVKRGGFRRKVSSSGEGRRNPSGSRPHRRDRGRPSPEAGAPRGRHRGRRPRRGEPSRGGTLPPGGAAPPASSLQAFLSFCVAVGVVDGAAWPRASAVPAKGYGLPRTGTVGGPGSAPFRLSVSMRPVKRRRSLPPIAPPQPFLRRAR